MLKYAIQQWDNNKAELEKVLADDENICTCDYEYLVKLVIRHILNGKNRIKYFISREWSEEVDVVDNGDYQGTLLFAIHLDTYQPASYEYLFSTVEYGSCSGCDALLWAQDCSYGKLEDWQIKKIMCLCKDIVTSMVQPYKGRCGFDLDSFEGVD